jgi:hypothetical protein
VKRVFDQVINDKVSERLRSARVIRSAVGGRVAVVLKPVVISRS